MSADVRVARAIQEVRELGRQVGPARPTAQEWHEYRQAVDGLIDEAMSALGLSNVDVELA